MLNPCKAMNPGELKRSGVEDPGHTFLKKG
jgi:hypothetical protein